ncbi:tol-pal system protein [Paracoccus fistulariae]|uniref:tol-pal system protein n=1 Tax=Paracoccus fistulariae TaxID=658446 RepID=UPI00232B6FCD|nr:tol-pal system protein [Paracoccus fistulariae]MDB6182734.1 tol-pal system protein [Paracoccus fistulariae]
MIRRTIAAASLAALMVLPGIASADNANLADLRADLDLLRGDVQQLRRELVASGAAGYQAAGGDAAIDRMNNLEQQLARVTNQTEQLQNRINRIVQDGNRRVADIEFRLCEMDESCDLAALTTQDLGGPSAGGVSHVAPVIAPPLENSKAATASEQADFDAAAKVMANGDFRRAAQMFGDVAETHAGGPLTAEALFLRGASLDSAGDHKGAAAAWLEGFAADPDGARAAESLLGIARVIADNDDPVAACLYLAEIPARFPGSASATEAETRMSRLACGSNDLTMPTGSHPFDPAASGMDPEATADLAEHN